MRYICYLLSCFVFTSAYGQSSPGVLSYVQPLVGTAASTTIASAIHGNGSEQFANTIPAVGVPFGMTQWTPQTRTTEMKCRPPYNYKDSLFSGFRGTHWLSGSCTQDYGSFTIMPVAGPLQVNTADYAVPFSHTAEQSAPNYYGINLGKYQLFAEVTALARSSIMRFTINQDDSLHLLIIPNSDQGKGYVKINREKNQIEGYNPAHRIYQGWGKPAGFSGYFVVQVKKTFAKSGTFNGNNITTAASIANQPGIGAYVSWKLKMQESIIVRVGTSFTSLEEAEKNLAAEIPHQDFNRVKEQSASIWEKALQKIVVKGSDESARTIFYTALYHTMQQPRLFSDVSGTYPAFAQQYKTARVSGRQYYDDFSMWDIYRAHLPLYEIIAPSLINDFINSVIIKGKQGGWLPIFPCWNNYTAAMIGDHVTAFIAAAYLKGIKDYDIETAYQLMRKNAFDSPDSLEYAAGKGRRALKSYLKYGYIPLEDSVPDAFHKKEQVSRTLEYAYNDYALSMVAKALHKKEDYRQLATRALNYRHVFDTTVGFVRGRYANGDWYTPFTPDKRMFYITEGTPRQYTFYVPQDVPGLVRLMGGKRKFETALDSVFYKKEYWHGNEPDQQIPFMYNYTDAPWKTQLEVRKILADEYSTGPGGLSGNDDAGQISAWYVLASMGMYPLDPVSGKYLLCSPLFDDITIHLEGNKTFRIITHKESDDAKYIAAIKLNNKKYAKNYLDYASLIKGGTLEIHLTNQPVNIFTDQQEVIN
ncbi:GH92 family glycosyl hydrolase [Chitinophaga sp. MM2321]|uniref:GH92 family glycosyl hydrolase n=1 Tax=Chitinophaga sp. MM2321 TaxID=3137178 RepID=UPI0032D568F6